MVETDLRYSNRIASYGALGVAIAITYVAVYFLYAHKDCGYAKKEERNLNGKRSNGILAPLCAHTYYYMDSCYNDISSLTIYK